MRCQGYIRNGGMMTLGPVEWRQCTNTAQFMITVSQEGVTARFPACSDCRDEYTRFGIDIIAVENIPEETE